MNKEAIAAKAILKTLGKYVAPATVVGTGAGIVGYRVGANRMGNEMATAFSEANTKENKAIVDSFKAFNKKENAVIANRFLRKGINVGYNMATTKPAAPTMQKTSSEIANEAFIDELEKLGFAIKPLVSLGMKGVKALRTQFSSLGKGLKAAGSSAIAGIKSPAGMRSTHFGLARDRALSAAKTSPYAASLAGGAGALGTGYAFGKSKPKRTIVDYRY